MKKSSKYFIALMLTIGFIFFGKGIYIQAKAILAQYVITSYSIHYTKLYDLLASRKREVRAF